MTRLYAPRAVPIRVALVVALAVGSALAPPPVSLPALLPTAPPAREASPGPLWDVASWYGAWHHGRPTASGEPYDMEAMTAAHRSLPLGACLEVMRLANGRRVFVRVNDRGPYADGRTIDLSHRAAELLEMVEAGIARVRLRPARPEACEGSAT